MLSRCGSDAILSDQEYGKKLVEEIELEPFLKEYVLNIQTS
jgi:hypothetical protein